MLAVGSALASKALATDLATDLGTVVFSLLFYLSCNLLFFLGLSNSSDCNFLHVELTHTIYTHE